MCKMTLAVLCAAGLALGLAGAAQASLITGVSAAASTEWEAYSGGPQRPASRTTDNSGMSDSGSPTTENFSTDFATPPSPTHGKSETTSMWMSKEGVVVTDQWISFTFSTAQTIAEFAVWNYNEANYTNRSIKGLTVYAYDSSNALVGSLTTQFAQAGGTATEPGQSFVPSTNWTNVKKVTFDVATNWGGNAVGLGEARFYTPEPATLALLGFGGLGMLLSRKRR